MNTIARRTLLKMAASLPLLGVLGQTSPAASDRLGAVLPTRTLGRTGLDVTMLGIGGGAQQWVDDDDAITICEAALEGGCRFFETARIYGKGRVEELWGREFVPRVRDDIVLLSKSRSYDAATFTRDLEDSLRALRTERIDIYLLHTLASVEDARTRLAQGVYDAARQAKAQGKIKHIGFSSHADHRAADFFIDQRLPEMEVAFLPVNLVDPARGSYVMNTLPRAAGQGLGVIAMKVLGGGSMTGEPVRWSHGGFLKRGLRRESIVPAQVSLDEALGFAWSLPVTTSTMGCSTLEHVADDIAALRKFEALSEAKRAELIERVATLAEIYPYEHYKPTSADG